MLTVLGWLSWMPARAGTFTSLPPPPGYLVDPVAINNIGQMVGGAFSFKSNSLEEFTYSAGTFNFFTIPQAVRETVPTAINDRGEVVGYYRDANELDHGFIWNSSGAITTFDVPGAVQTAIQDINDAGDFVGWYQVGGSTTYGFQYSAGKLSVINASNDEHSPGTFAMGINNEGQIIGSTYTLPTPFFPSGGWSIFEESNGAIKRFALTIPGYDLKALSVEFYPTAINDRGEFVGTLTNGLSDGAAFSLAFTSGPYGENAGAFYPSYPYAQPYSINDEGQIIVSGPNGNLIYTPSPEPSSTAMIGSAGFVFLLFLGLTAKGRKKSVDLTKRDGFVKRQSESISRRWPS